MDGDLSDWSFHSPDRCYTDVPFAKLDGTEVVFETHGTGKYYGPKDFSIKWMLAWDGTYLYMAAKVTDDRLQTSNNCYENGLQMAFEVGGPEAKQPFMLQAERSADLATSRLELINLALKAEETSCSSHGSDEQVAGPDPTQRPETARIRPRCWSGG